MKMINHLALHIMPGVVCLTLVVILPSSAQVPANMEEMRSCLEQIRQYEMQSWQEAIAWEKKHAGRDLNFDSRYVKIDIEVHFSDSTIHATVETMFKSLANGLDEIMLDFDDALTIDSVFVNGNGYVLAGESLIVSLDQTYDSGEVFTVATTYHGRPRIVGNVKGFRFVSHQGIPVVATLCTPYLAHTWWPCVDGPADKLDSVHLYITIPDTSYAGYSLYAASNGKLISVTPAQSGWATYEWHEDYPIVPYYVSIAISNYLIFSG